MLCRNEENSSLIMIWIGAICDFAIFPVNIQEVVQQLNSVGIQLLDLEGTIARNRQELFSTNHSLHFLKHRDDVDQWISNIKIPTEDGGLDLNAVNRLIEKHTVSLV